MGRVEVFHLGALGDSVMVWPLLRAMARAGWDVEFVASGEHAALAAREIGAQIIGNGGRGASTKKRGAVRGMDIHKPEFERWWLGAEDGVTHVREDVQCVVTLCADEATESGRRWLAAARRARPNARVEAIGPAGSPSRAAAWKTWEAARLGGVEHVPNAGGPVVLFVGTGSRSGEGDKRWPMAEWMLLHHAAARIGRPEHRNVEVVAGLADEERWNEQEAVFFKLMAMDNQRDGVVKTLDELAQRLRGARLVASCDTGPAHLAAQLGVHVLALFGPTDPRVWAPVGPKVTVVAPPKLKAMSWLNAGNAAVWVGRALAQA